MHMEKHDTITANKNIFLCGTNGVMISYVCSAPLYPNRTPWRYTNAVLLLLLLE